MSVLVKKYLLNTIREVILEEESAEFKQELRNKMKRHDWAYEWSDDSRYHRAGRESESIIIGLLSKLPPEESKELWSMYAPKNMPFPERRIYNKPKLPPQKLSQREQKIGKEKLKFQESNDQQQKIEEIYTRAIKSAGVSEVAFDQMFADHVLRRMSYNEIVDILSEVIKSFERLKGIYFTYSCLKNKY